MAAPKPLPLGKKPVRDMPFFELVKKDARAHGMSDKEMADLMNGRIYWLKHQTLDQPATIQVSNAIAGMTIFRAVTKIEATSSVHSLTFTINGFMEYWRRLSVDMIDERARRGEPA
jgi:hypothetical protein